MAFELSAEQRELTAVARRVLADRARDPLPPSWEARAAGLDRELWASLGELGLLGLGVPEDRGGSGAGVRELCLLAGEAGAALARIPFVAMAALLDMLSAEVDGSVVAVPAWETFPFVDRRDPLRLNGSIVDGVLRAVPFGADADLVLGYADDTPVLIDLSAPGVRRTPVDTFDVTEPAASIELAGAAVTVLRPAEISTFVLTVLAAELVGTGRRALDGAVDYAKQRHQFGRAIGSFQAIKHLLADRFVQLDAANLLVEWAAVADDSHVDADLAARTALAAASDAASAATADALQAHGGIGFTWEHRSHVYLMRTRSRRSLLGSPARQLNQIADRVLAARH
jgi:alkylation response protein AidB-like acyl-CoA dehydrogenase